MAGTNLYDDSVDQFVGQTPALQPAPAPAQPDNPYDALVGQVTEQRQGAQRDALKRALETTPDKAVEARTIAERENLPLSVVERHFETLKKQAALKAAPLDQIAQESPKLATWLSDPANAAIASDDLEPLRGLSKTLSHPHARTTERAVTAGRMLWSGLQQGVAGLFGALEAGAVANAGFNAPINAALRAKGLPPMPSAIREDGTPAGTFYQGMRKAISEIAAEGKPTLDGASMLEKGIYSGIESIGMMAPGFAASVATGSPAPMLGVLGTSTYGQSYGKAVDAGIGPQRAVAFGALDAAIEVATEFIPAKWFFADLAKQAGIVQLIKHQLGAEVPGELIATTLQSLNEFATLRPEEPIQTYLDELPSALAETVVATVTMVGVMGAAGKVMTSMAGDGGRAKQAEHDQQFFQELASSVKGSQTVARMPPAAQALIADLTKDGPVESVFAPVESFETYWQDKALETSHGRVAGAAAVAGELTGRADALEEARRSGADLEIPTSVYAVQLAGTEHHTFMAEELRLGSPDRMNARELKEFRDAETAKAAEPQADEQVTPDPIRQEILQKLQAAVAGTNLNLPPGAIEGYADIFQALTATFEREGVDPVETLKRYGLLVTGPQEGTTKVVPFKERLAAIAKKQAEQPAPVVEPAAPEPAGTTIHQEAPDVTAANEAMRAEAAAAGPAYLDPIAIEAGRKLQARLAKDVSTLDQVVTLFQDAPEEPTATYLGEQEDGLGGSYSLYNIVGGPQHKSTVTGETLMELGIPIPPAALATPEMTASEIVQQSNAEKLQRTLFQNEEDHPPKVKRGAITGPFERNAFFGPDLQFTIKLFEQADVSTFLHESAHLFLKIMQDLEARPEATATLKNDLALIRTKYGPDGVEQHESFARAFEAYLLEGKAPSLALQAVFSNFRKWLGRVYRTLTRLQADLTDDVRDVFDRMLASDAAIAEAQAAVTATPMFTTAESARMSLEEFAVYQKEIADAGRVAREELEGKLLKDLQRQQRADYRAEKQALRETVQAEVYAMPVYQALAAMRHGTRPDGTPLVDGEPAEPLKLSRQIIRERYGKDRLAALPKVPPQIHVEDGGMDPDVVAELFGFASGDALLTAVAEALPMRGLIAAETHARMTAQAGDLMVDDTLSDLAKAAVANEHREAIVRIELQTLARLRRTAQAGAVKEREYERRWFEAEAKLRIAIAEGRKQAEMDAERGKLTAKAKKELAAVRAAKEAEIAALEAEVKALKKQARAGAQRILAALISEADLREIARARIGRTRIRDLKPQVFYTAARRAGAQATAAAAKQDFDKAIGFKQQEAISLALYREATRVVEDVEARVRAAQKLDQPSSRKRIGLAGARYQEQIDDILDRYEFASLSGKALRKREALRAWIAELEKDGMSADFPARMIDDARQIHYRELTVDDLIEVSDTLTAIVHLAQLKNRLLANLDERDFTVVRDRVVASIREHNDAKPLPLEFRDVDERRRSLGEWFASHARIGTLAQVMDGPGDGGAVWSAVVRPINAAADAKATRNAKEGTAYAQIMAKHYPGRELGRWHERLHIPAIGASLSKEARLAVALNSGNQSSRDRLVNDPRRKWTQQQVNAILDTLDERDWRFVVDTWRFLDRFWPEIAAKTKRLTGVEPERVEGIPVITKFGTFEGGYYPLAYDPRLNIQSQQHEAVTEAKLNTSAAYVRTTTRRGHEEARVQNVKLSVKLDLGVMFNHLEQVIHDLTHHEMLIDVTRLLRDPAVSNAILETKGDVVYQQFTRGLEAIAKGKLDPAKNGMEHAANVARTGTQIALLGFNLWTGLQQPIGLFNGMERVGVRWVAKGLGRWLHDTATMQKTTAWIDAASPFMASRSSAATQDLADLRSQLRTSGGWFDTLIRTVTVDRITQQHILDAFLWHIGVMQRVADVPTWLGQYEKSKASGETEARAISLADQAVIDAQGSGRISDLSQVQRGGPIARLFLTFYSYGSATYNATYRRAGQTNFRSPAQVTRFLAGVSLIYLVPSMATVALSRLVGKSGGDDDDEIAAYMEDVGRETLSAALNGMVWVRELAQLTSDGTRGYAGPAGARALQLLYQLAGQVKQGEVDEALVKALNQVGGVLFRYPSAQLQRTIDGWRALVADETDNPAALLFGPPKDSR